MSALIALSSFKDRASELYRLHPEEKRFDDGPAMADLASSAHCVCRCAGIVASLPVCQCCIYYIRVYPGQIGAGGPVIVCP